MRHRMASALVLAGILFGAAIATAAAQDAPASPNRSLVPASFPRWDVGGSLGFLSASNTETRTSWDGWEAKAEYRADVGRYWTTHLKTEVAVTASNPWDDYESVGYPVAGITAPTYAYIDSERQLFSVAPAITWQFRENTFMHPYVSGGVKVGMLQEHRVREAGTYRAGGLSYTVPPLEERSTTVTARPFIAGGFKSYMSRSVFVRTEGRLAFAKDGVRQVSVIVGIGVDF